MIFQFLQNKLHLTSMHMHILFIVLMGLYLMLQIVDRVVPWFTTEVRNLNGTTYRLRRNTDIWYKLDKDTNAWLDSNGKKFDQGKKTSKPSFVTSVLVSIVLGLELWMLIMAISAFLPETIIGRPSFPGELGREFGNLGYQLLSYVSLGGIIALPIIANSCADDIDERFNFTVISGSILPFYGFIFSVMPVNTEIFFGIFVILDIVLLVTGLILETVLGGRFSLVRGLLEYAVSFALFSSLLSFPEITKHFFAVLGFVVVLVGAGVWLIGDLFGSTGGSTGGENNSDSTEGTIYNVLSESYDKVVVQSEYGEELTYYKLADTWVSNIHGRCEAPAGLELISKISRYTAYEINYEEKEK